jgi:hypothetical protein
MMAETALIPTPDQRVRVFVSSALQDLAAERRMVRDAIAGLRLVAPPDGRQSVPAGPGPGRRHGAPACRGAGQAVIGTCTLGLAFEGPPAFAHGGISAMLLDQLLGYVASAAGHPGMTVKLETRYLAPVPLQTPLRLTAEVSDVNGRHVTAHGTIASAADPDTVLVEASGAFVALRPEQAARLFGGIRPDATDPQVAHD